MGTVGNPSVDLPAKKTSAALEEAEGSGTGP